MRKILNVVNPNDYASFIGAPVLHPLLSAIHFDELAPFRHSLNSYGVYGLFIQRQFPKGLSYGVSTFDASDASIIAVAPGQIGGLEDNGELITLNGWALLWSPELMHGTDLEERIKDYQYFSYFATEPLRMEPSEWEAIGELLVLLRKELTQSHNHTIKQSNAVLLGYLRLLLEYCNRIYIRQQSRHDTGTSDLLKRFHALLERYYLDGRQLTDGLPTVKWCASELAYSPRYFGDMVHQATGGTAIGYIHTYVINQGKSLLMNGRNVNETARLLGFDYPHHFTRLFKKLTGLTPTEFMKH